MEEGYCLRSGLCGFLGESDYADYMEQDAQPSLSGVRTLAKAILQRSEKPIGMVDSPPKLAIAK